MQTGFELLPLGDSTFSSGVSRGTDSVSIGRCCGAAPHHVAYSFKQKVPVLSWFNHPVSLYLERRNLCGWFWDVPGLFVGNLSWPDSRLLGSPEKMEHCQVWVEETRVGEPLRLSLAL